MNFAVFDTEDDSKELLAANKSGFDKTVTQIAAITRIMDSGTHIPGPVFHNRGNVNEFLNWIVKISEKHGIKKWFAHNLQYDLGNLFADRIDELEMVMVGGRLIRAKWQKILFVDSYNLFPTSVAKLGSALGLEKMEMDIHSREYVFRDCEIPALAIEKLTETCSEFELDEPSNTLGGLCVSIWKAMGGTNNSDTSLFSRAAIFGGRVEIFQPGGAGTIVCTDINSLYPSVMRQEYPGELQKCERMMKFGITRATVFIPDQHLAPLPFRVTKTSPIEGVDEHAILFPCGRITGTWTNAELFHAVEYHECRIEKVIETWGTDESSTPYGKFVEEFYRRRLAADSEAYKLIYKLLMNNLYGQLGMGGVVTRSLPLTEERAMEIRTGKREATIFGDALLFDVAIPLPEHVNYAHAAYVTAYGRIALLAYLRKIPKHDLIYCDTDSCFFFQAPDTPIPFATGHQLGEMKIEGVASEIHVLAPKTYTLTVNAQIKSKAKGVPSRHAAGFITTKVASYEAPFKMREAVNFFDRANVEWVEDKTGRMKPVLGPCKRGNARRLSVWRKVKKELLSEYSKKTRNPLTGAFTPLTLGVRKKKNQKKEKKDLTDLKK
jgi:hypothetical protein